MSDNKVSFPLIPASEVQVLEGSPVLQALQIIENSIAKIALVVDNTGRLTGSVTDGDIRRAFLRGCTPQSPVGEVMYPYPKSLPASSTKSQIIELMLAEKIKQIPLLEPDGTLLGIVIYDMLTGFERVPRSNPVVIMAGGKGKRLLPLTADIPKPMIEVGGKPILEKILQHFITQGFSNFYFAVNYLSNVIEDYFDDGSRWNCHIKYIREKEFLGTAGALSLVKAEINESFIVINGDIITSLDFCDLLDYHNNSNAIATVCVRQHLTSVPYGVIKLKDGKLEAIVEKPVYEDLISAGIYAFAPQVIDYISDGTVIDMPDVLLSLAKTEQKVDIFPMKEDWVDVGRHDDLEQLKLSFS